jgi:hypothetical protein
MQHFYSLLGCGPLFEGVSRNQYALENTLETHWIRDLFSLFFVLGVLGFELGGLMFARWALYHLSHSTSPRDLFRR